jgi:hypothetical protein
MNDYDVTFEIVGVVTVEAESEAEAMSSVQTSSVGELIADSHSVDMYMVDAIPLKRVRFSK